MLEEIAMKSLLQSTSKKGRKSPAVSRKDA